MVGMVGWQVLVPDFYSEVEDVSQEEQDLFDEVRRVSSGGEGLERGGEVSWVSQGQPVRCM